MKNYNNGYRGNGGRNGGRNYNNRNRSNWSPVGCGRVVNIELDQRILNSLHEFCEVDGVGSVFQMIRNILYKYVTERNGGNTTESEKVTDDVHQDADSDQVTFIDGAEGNAGSEA